jgi:Spy/CpxP family protein refolding chaperone
MKGFLMQKHIFPLVLALLTIALFSTTITRAQMRRPSVEERAQTLKDSLQLSDEQLQKVTVILKDEQKESQDAMSENKGDRETFRPIMMEIMKKTDAKITALLSPEQVQKYEALKKNRRGHMMRPHAAQPDSTK